MGVVFSESLKSGAPMIWWSIGGHDPLYLIEVPAELVDPTGFDGFHAVAPSVALVGVLIVAPEPQSTKWKPVGAPAVTV